MTSVYVIGRVGPWLCDDDNVLCDGHGVGDGLYRSSRPTLDGVAPPQQRRPVTRYPGMVWAEKRPATVRTR